VHVGLAAATARSIDHPLAERLLDRVVGVIDEHLWDESTGSLYESFDRDWTHPEDYRGANANMHGVEAMLALGEATGDRRWTERALRMADRIINTHARAND